MAEVVLPPGLSLLAEFDDLNRCNSILNDGAAEEYFLQFLALQSYWQQQLSGAVTETGRLQKDLQESLKAISAWEAKFIHARKLLDSEKKKRLRAEQERDTLEKQMTLARDLLFNENKGRINNETLEKFAFLNNTTHSRSTNVGLEPLMHPRLNTITELNSTGTLLSDQSFSRSEDDLDESLVNRRKSWKRHRPSAPVPPSMPASDGHSSAKKRCSSGGSKVESNTMSTTNTNKLIATTTVTVDRCGECSGNGKIIASSVIEGVVNNENDSDELPINLNSLTTPKSTKTQYNIKITSKGDKNGHYTTNIKNCPPPIPIKTKESDNGFIVGGTGGVGSPRGTARLRQHTFTSKTVIRPEPCTTCGTRIRFARAVVKCTDCRAICHMECKNNLPLPCVPCNGTPSSNGANQMGTIADYTPNVSPMVPALVIHCVNEVEARGLTEVGLYRVPGSEKEVKALKDRFMKHKGAPPLNNIDINVICGCIKDFLRSLREPLITYSLWSGKSWTFANFVSATELSDRNDSEAALYQAISELPQPNRDTLAFMMLHLQRVAECVECKMPVQNLSKVFGPTIIGYSDNDPDPSYMYQQTAQQFAVMERLLEISSDYWARFAAVTYSDGSSVVATPPLHRTPSLRPRINTMPQSLPHSTMLASKDILLTTPSLTSSSKSSASQTGRRGFFYTPVNGSNISSRQRKFYGTPDGI